MELDELEEDFEGAGAAALDFLDILDALPGALSAFSTTAAQAGSAARDMNSRLAETGGAAKQATESASSMGGAMSSLAGAIAGVGTAAAALAGGPIPSATQAGQQLGAALGGALTGAADSAAKALGQLGPEGEAAGAALQAVTGVVAATVGTLGTLMGIAVDAAQRVDLLRDALAGLAGGAAAGASAGKVIDGLVASLPFARAQTEQWATSLIAVGEAGETLAAHVRAIAAAQALTAVTGGQGGAAAEKLFKMLALGGAATDAFMRKIATGGRQGAALLAEMGLNMADLGGQAAIAKMNASQFGDAVTKALQNRGAGALGDMMLELPNILTKAKEGFLSLFNGVDVKPFMSEIKSLFGMFNKGGGAINGLKPIITSVFGTLFSLATSAAHAVHAGFLMITIAALKVYIAVKPIIDKIKELAKSGSFLLALKALIIPLALPFVVVAAAVASVVVTIGVLVAALGAIVAAVAYVGAAIFGFVDGAAAALADWIGGAAGAAADFVAGLVNGIASGAGAVADAVIGLAKGALSAFTGIFRMGSPSKIMLEHGEDNIAGAAATGVDRGAGKMNDAMARLGPNNKGSGGGKKVSGGRGKLAEKIEINFYGPAKDFPSFEEQANAWLEKLDAQAPS